MTNLSTTLTYKLRKGEGRKWNNGRDSCHLCTWHGFFFCLDYDLPVFSFLLPEWGGWANHQRDWKFLYCWFYLNNLFSDLIVLWRNRSIYSKTCFFTMDGVWLVGLNSQLGAAHYIIADGEGRVSSNDLQRGCPNSFITRKQNSGPPPCEGALPLQRGTWCLKIITSSYQGMPYFLRYCFRTPTSLNDKSFLCQKDSLHFFFWADFFENLLLSVMPKLADLDPCLRDSVPAEHLNIGYWKGLPPAQRLILLTFSSTICSHSFTIITKDHQAFALRWSAGLPLWSSTSSLTSSPS